MADEPGFVIGLETIYHELRTLGDKVTAGMNSHALEISALQHRVEALEKEQVRNAAAKAQAFWALVTAFVLPLLVGVLLAVAAFVLK